jgi:DNA replication protein DnaC
MGFSPANGDPGNLVACRMGPAAPTDRFDLLILDNLGLRQQGPGRDQLAVLAHQRTLRAALDADPCQSAARRMEQVFPDPAMTLAAIDRPVHHATTVEVNIEGYRRWTALERERGLGRPLSHATRNPR